MSNYQGDFTPGKTVRLKFPTHKADGTPATLSGTPVVSVYKGGSTTESTAGVTLTVDYDSRTGCNDVLIDTSADGTFYAAANDFELVITAGTVDSISVVGTPVGSFSLSNRSALRPATADRTLVVDAAGLADANTVKVGPSGSGTAQTATDIGGYLATNLGANGANLTGIAAIVWNALTSGMTTAGSIGKLLATITFDAGNNVKASLQSILGTALTESVGGYLTAAFKRFFNVATPTATADTMATLANQTSILSAVNAITTNTARSAPRVPGFMPRPASSSVAYTADLYLYNLQGQLEDADTNTVTVHARNAAGTSLDSGLSSTTMTRISAGFYRFTYTVNSTDTAQAVYFDFSWAVNSTAMKDGAATEVQDAENYAYLVAIKAQTDKLTFDVSNNVKSTPQTSVTVGTNSDKTGYGLASDGLDSISTTAPAGVAANFREMLVALWRRSFKKSTLTATELKTLADDGTTVLTTQTVSDDGTTQTQGGAS